MPPSTLASYVAIPHVAVDGQQPDGLASMLRSLRVEETTDGLGRCEICVDAWGTRAGRPGYLWFGRDTIDFGAEITVRVGPPDEAAEVFTGRVTGLEGRYPHTASTSLIVLAEDRLQDLRMTRRTRTFTDTTDADLIRQVAREHGLTAEVDVEGPSHRQVAQLNQSDLRLLRDRARTLGADLWLTGSALHVARPPASDPIVLRYGRELMSFRVLADVALQCTEQRVGGWDVSSKEPVLESADPSAVSAEVEDGVDGGSLLQEKFGERAATVVLGAATSAAEARGLARGLYVERARRFVTGSGVVDGIAGLRCGRTVTLSGLGQMFDGPYEMSRVAHRFDLDDGYRTEIDVQRPGVGR